VELINILRLVPNWARQYSFCILLWVGISYFFVTPIIYDRITLPLRNEFIATTISYNRFHYDDVQRETVADFIECNYSGYFYENRLEITYWVSSFGYYNDGLSSNAMEKYFMNPKTIAICGKMPWNKYD